MKAATLLPLLLLASSAEAQNRFFSSTWGRSPMGAKYAATLYAGDGVVLAKSTELADIEADITARNACNNAGKVYLPASPDADAGGCVDPSIWGGGAWQVTAWGACSVSCGGGTQTRTVSCVSSSGNSLPDSKCPTPKPDTSQACNTQGCPCNIGWTSNANYNGTVIAGTMLTCQTATSYSCWGGWQCATCQWTGNGPGGNSGQWTMWGYRVWQNGAMQNGWTYQGVSGGNTIYRCR